MSATPRRAAPRRAAPRRAAPRRTSPHLTALHCAGKTYNMNVIHERAPAELFAALAADGRADATAAAALPSIGLISYELVGKKSFDLLSDEKGEVQLRADAKGRIQATGPAAYHPLSYPHTASPWGAPLRSSAPRCTTRMYTCT